MRMPWFRFYTEALDDPKVQRLTGDLFKAWVNLLCLANESEERGTLPAVEDIAFRLRLDDQKAEDAVRGLIRAKLIDEAEDGAMSIHGWDNRQFPSDEDSTATERKRRERERNKAKEGVTRDVTRDRGVTSRTSHGRSHGHVTRLDTDTEKIERRKEKTQSRPQQAAADAPRKPVTAVPAAANPLWDALVSGIGIEPKTPGERSRYGKAVKELKEINATPGDVLTHCANYTATWPQAELTPEALLKHWSRMEHPPSRAPTVGVVGGGISKAQARDSGTISTLLAFGERHKEHA